MMLVAFRRTRPLALLSVLLFDVGTALLLFIRFESLAVLAPSVRAHQLRPEGRTWLLLHMEAFEHFGGVPAVIVPDNLKSAVIRAAFSPSEATTLNRSYRELARRYGFKIAPTPPRSPENNSASQWGDRDWDKSVRTDRSASRSVPCSIG